MPVNKPAGTASHLRRRTSVTRTLTAIKVAPRRCTTLRGDQEVPP